MPKKDAESGQVNLFSPRSFSLALVLFSLLSFISLFSLSLFLYFSFSFSFFSLSLSLSLFLSISLSLAHLLVSLLEPWHLETVICICRFRRSHQMRDFDTDNAGVILVWSLWIFRESLQGAKERRPPFHWNNQFFSFVFAPLAGTITNGIQLVVRVRTMHQVALPLPRSCPAQQSSVGLPGKLNTSTDHQQCTLFACPCEYGRLILIASLVLRECYLFCSFAPTL